MWENFFISPISSGSRNWWYEKIIPHLISPTIYKVVLLDLTLLECFQRSIYRYIFLLPWQELLHEYIWLAYSYIKSSYAAKFGSPLLQIALLFALLFFNKLPCLTFCLTFFNKLPYFCLFRFVVVLADLHHRPHYRRAVNTVCKQIQTINVHNIN